MLAFGDVLWKWLVGSVVRTDQPVVTVTDCDCTHRGF